MICNLMAAMVHITDHSRLTTYVDDRKAETLFPSAPINYCYECDEKKQPQFWDFDDMIPHLAHRIKVTVGGIAFGLPTIVLTRHSKFFRTALEASIGYAEAQIKTVDLPEEDARDFMILLRYLIEPSTALYELKDPHWPLPCNRKTWEFCSICS